MSSTSSKGVSAYFAVLTTAAVALGALVGLSLSALLGGRFGAPGSVSSPMFYYWLGTLGGFILGLLSVAIAKALRRGAPLWPQRQLGVSVLVGFVAALLQGAAEEIPPRSMFLVFHCQALLAWPWGSRKVAVPEPPSVASLWRRTWALPFLIPFGMAFGSMIGFGLATGDALERDPVGSLGALLFLINVAAGFILALITVVILKALKRDPPDRHGVRFLLSFVAGALNAASAWTFQEGGMLSLGGVLLLVPPIVLVWPWRRKAPPTPPDSAPSAPTTPPEGTA